MAGSVAGQFENLATVDDGNVVYFTTVLRPRKSDHPPYFKIYGLAGGEFRLVASDAGRDDSMKTGGWLVESASVSGDGRVLAVSSSAPCRFGIICVSSLQEFSAIQVDGLVTPYKGHAQISRSGRYGLLLRTTGFGLCPVGGPGCGAPPSGVSRLDLKTGAIAFLGGKPAGAGHWIAEDGSILRGYPPGNWELVGPSGLRETLGPAPFASRAVLADDASFVVYQVSPPNPSGSVPAITELRIRDRYGADRQLAAAGVFPSISADSRQILFLAPVDGKLQTFLLGRGHVLARQVSFEPEGLTEAVLSGDAGLVVAVTGLGRLVTLNVRNGDRTEHIGITPKLEPFRMMPNGGPIWGGPQAPGSIYSIRGERLASETVRPEPPLPLELGGVRVLVNGQPAALSQISPKAITYQVAWETPVGESHCGDFAPAEVVLQSGDPGWEAVSEILCVSSFSPGQMELGRETAAIGSLSGEFPIYAIHGDWRGLVTPSDPARPGEYVHAYAAGWGAVRPPVPTGFVSPADPPAMILEPCDWRLYGFYSEEPVKVRVALAPGLVGIYQVTAWIPEDYPKVYFSPACVRNNINYSILSAFVQKP
jgi:uncharacterized protein (TIGR03437 family)